MSNSAACSDQTHTCVLCETVYPGCAQGSDADSNGRIIRREEVVFVPAEGVELDLPVGPVCSPCIQRLLDRFEIVDSEYLPRPPRPVETIEVIDVDPLDPPFPIECVECNSKFEGFAPEQAMGCATEWSFIYETLDSFYGSVFYGVPLKIVGPAMDVACFLGGFLCDRCIACAIDRGVVRRLDNPA